MEIAARQRRVPALSGTVDRRFDPRTAWTAFSSIGTIRTFSAKRNVLPKSGKKGASAHAFRRRAAPRACRTSSGKSDGRRLRAPGNAPPAEPHGEPRSGVRLFGAPDCGEREAPDRTPQARKDAPDCDPGIAALPTGGRADIRRAQESAEPSNECASEAGGSRSCHGSVPPTRGCGRRKTAYSRRSTNEAIAVLEPPGMAFALPRNQSELNLSRRPLSPPVAPH